MVFFTTLAWGHGFGLNTDVFETNVINLAIVLYVVISFGGNALRETLTHRKQTIVDNLSVAAQREEEAKKKVALARTKLRLAEEECEELRTQGETAKANAKAGILEEGKAKRQALKRGSTSALDSERMRVYDDYADFLIGASLERADKKLRQRAKKPTFYDWVMDYKIKKKLDLRVYKHLFKPESDAS